MSELKSVKELEDSIKRLKEDDYIDVADSGLLEILNNYEEILPYAKEIKQKDKRIAEYKKQLSDKDRALSNQKVKYKNQINERDNKNRELKKQIAELELELSDNKMFIKVVQNQLDESREIAIKKIAELEKENDKLHHVSELEFNSIYHKGDKVKVTITQFNTHCRNKFTMQVIENYDESFFDDLMKHISRGFVKGITKPEEG